MKFEVGVTSSVEENGNLSVFYCGQHNISVLQSINVISCILKEKVVYISPWAETIRHTNSQKQDIEV